MDITLKDLNRRELEFNKNFVLSALPQYFVEEYPNVIKFLEYYLEFVKEQGTGTISLDDLRSVRDITQTSEELLAYIENELLLGENYFQGFEDRRAAALYSSNLYRTKGSKYSIQQFFRTFYGVDPEIVYTKNNVFHVYGYDQTDSLIGPESEKYLLDNRLYQTFALLIKVPLPISTWREAYKLFVHPAGFYFEGQVQIVSTVTETITTPEVIPAEVAPTIYETSVASVPITTTSITGLIFDDSAETMRINLYKDIGYFTTFAGTDSDSLLSLADADAQYQNMEEIMQETSPTFDDDSDTGIVAIRMSNTIETMDLDKFVWWDSDSDGYQNQLTNLTNL